jgi:hypothetical protein
MKQIVHHVLHPGGVRLTGALGMAVLGLRGLESSHDSSGGVRHGGGDWEAESGIALSTRRGGAGRWQQLREAWHHALGVEERGISRSIKLRARMSGAPVTVTVVLR